MWWFLFACSVPPVDGPSCADLPGGDPPATESDLVDVFTEAREVVPELDDVTIRFETSLESDSVFFVSNLVLSTLTDPPREREYLIQANPLLYEDPPSRSAVQAILVHELGHTRDFAEMDTEELAAFGVWYGSADDVSEYERQTDRFAVSRGCAAGLIGYRLWLYDHIDAEAEAEKRIDYWTPEELAPAW